MGLLGAFVKGVVTAPFEIANAVGEGLSEGIGIITGDEPEEPRKRPQTRR